MDRTRLRRATVGLLAVVAVVLTAVAAGPLFADIEEDDASPRLDRPATNGTGAGEVDTGTGAPIEILFGTLFLVGSVAIAVQFLSNPWEALQRFAAIAFSAGALIGFFAALLWLFDGRSGSEPPAGSNVTTPPAGNSSVDGAGGDPSGLPLDSIVVLLVIVGLVGVVAIIAWRSNAVQSALGADDREATPEGELDGVARIAGDTADRLEGAATGAAVDNAVYRAWVDMLSLLGISDPQSATPRQFEAEAIEAGLNPEDVRELTRTFEVVRYGDAPSDEYSDRALGAFRAIEAAAAAEADADETGRTTNDERAGTATQEGEE